MRCSECSVKVGKGAPTYAKGVCGGCSVASGRLAVPDADGPREPSEVPPPKPRKRALKKTSKVNE